MEAPSTGVSLSWAQCSNKHKKEELCFCAFSHWQEHSPELCFHTGALAIPQMLFIKQAALGVTADSYWGDPFHFKCWILIAKEPMSTTLRVHRSHELSNPGISTALLDPSKNHWIPQVLLSCFHLAICSRLCLKHTK